MNIIAKKYLLLLSSVTLLLNSCVGVSQYEKADNKSNACIPPISKIAYPIGTPTPRPANNGKKADDEPLGNWQFESALPEHQDRMNSPQIVVNSNHLWILPLDSKKIFRYDLITHEWQTYGAIDSYSAAPRTLALTRGGLLWGAEVIAENIDSTKNFPLLSWYNESTNQFEFVKDRDGILNNVSLRSSPATIVEDQNGLLWFWGALHGDVNWGLYSFNPSTLEAVRHLYLVQPDWFPGSTLAVDKDNSLWFYNARPIKQLFIYSPAADQLQPYHEAPDFEEFGAVSHLFFDAQENLWINGQSWIDLSNPGNPEWYKLILPPEFLTDNGTFYYSHGERLSNYGLEMPSQMFQSSNGWYWFTTFHGTIRLDPIKEEWCLFTTGSSPVVEDDKGNLWIVVFGKLYKYQTRK